MPFDLRVSVQLIEQAPGPRGSPQVPQGPGAPMRIEGPPPLVPLVCAANTDSRFSSAVAWQAGHSGVSFPRTSVSNVCAQALQAYSYSGTSGRSYPKLGTGPLLGSKVRW